MEEIRSSPTRTTTTPVASTQKSERDATSATIGNRMKNDCLYFMVSLRESFLYGKASLVGLVKKVMARNESEATKANLMAEKMQVDAANAAEHHKATIRKST